MHPMDPPHQTSAPALIEVKQNQKGSLGEWHEKGSSQKGFYEKKSEMAKGQASSSMMCVPAIHARTSSRGLKQ